MPILIAIFAAGPLVPPRPAIPPRESPAPESRALAAVFKMTTLAEDFMNDLDDLDDSEEEEENDDGVKAPPRDHSYDPSAKRREARKVGTAATATAAAANEVDDETKNLLADLEDSDDDDDDDDDNDDGAAAGEGSGDDDDGLDSMLAGQSEGLAAVATLRKSDRYVKHMKNVDEAQTKEPRQVILETDPEYRLIVDSNDLIHDIMEESATVFKFLADAYAKKFPELESMVPNPLEYAAVVKKMGNEMDMTLVDLEGVLPQSQIMVVCVTGSTTTGEKLTEESLAQVLAAAGEIEGLEEDRQRVLAFVESRMTALSPNMSAIVGSSIAAQLVGLAGGVAALTRIPACNLQVMGQEQKTLGGFSNAAILQHTGFVYQCALVQACPPHLRIKCSRVVANKCVLAARADALLAGGNAGEQRGDLGRKLRDDIVGKIEKWQEPPKGKLKKALPKPDAMPARKRGGKGHRRRKARLEATELVKARNTVIFGDDQDEYGDSAMGKTFGIIGKAGTGQLRVAKKKRKMSQKEEVKAKARQKQGKFAPGSSGLASSLAFTPVQGIELPDQGAELERKRMSSTQKYFGGGATFRHIVDKT